MPLSGFALTAVPQDILLDSGVLYLGATPIGVSRGGLKFDPGKVIRNIDFDGAKAPLKLLDRVTDYKAVFTGKMLQLGGSEAVQYDAGASTTFASATAVTGVVTPKKGGTAFVAGDYLANLKLVFERANNSGYVEIVFPNALCTKYTVTGVDMNEVEVDCTFEARLDPSASGATLYDAPYTIQGVATP